MPSVSEFLRERLENAGVKHIFGVKGPYIDSFLNEVDQSQTIKFVRNSDENYSGFSADAYARTNGIGCVCATYNTGALKLCNSIAGAYAERSPVVVISGAPGVKERNSEFLSNHLVESFYVQKNIFKHITVHSVVLEDATTAGWKIDNALNILRESKQPVYIELPRDVASHPIKYDVYTQGTPNNCKSDFASLKESIEDVTRLINDSKKPVIVAGVQVVRFHLEDLLLKFAEKNNVPIVTTFLSKSAVREDHPLFSGVYYGEQTINPEVKNLVESSDCLLIFGELLTDTSLGFVTPKFNSSNTIFCSVENLRIKNHIYCGVRFVDFCKDFFKIDLVKKDFFPTPKFLKNKFVPQEGKKINLKRFFEKINSILDDKLVVLTDIDKDFFEVTAELVVPQYGFISSAFYCSMGLALPGSIGLKFAKPELRPIVLISEESFQMCLPELNTIFSNNLNSIIFVLNKKNNFEGWNYDKICDTIQPGAGFVVDSEESLENVIDVCLKKKGPAVVNVSLFFEA